MTDSLPPSTHNNPPPLTLAERLTEENADLVKRAAEIEVGLDALIAKYVDLPPDRFDSISADFIGRNGVVNALLKQAEARRVEQVAPHLAAQRTINAFYDATLGQLQTPKDGETKVKTLKQLVTLIKEERGGATLAHGQFGTTSLRTRFVFAPDESDLMALAKAVVAGKAPLEYLAFNEKRIGYAVRSEKLRECPGLAIKEERSV